MVVVHAEEATRLVPDGDLRPVRDYGIGLALGHLPKLDQAHRSPVERNVLGLDDRANGQAVLADASEHGIALESFGAHGAAPGASRSALASSNRRSAAPLTTRRRPTFVTGTCPLEAAA